MLTQQTLIEKLKLKSEWYRGAFYSELFNEHLEIGIYSQFNNLKEDITQQIVDTMNMFLQLKLDILHQIKDEVWKHYLTVTSNTSYNSVPQELIKQHNGNETNSNRSYFSINSEEESFARAQISEAFISTDDLSPFFTLSFDIPWEEEHGITFTIRDSKIEYVE